MPGHSVYTRNPTELSPEQKITLQTGNVLLALGAQKVFNTVVRTEPFTHIICFVYGRVVLYTTLLYPTNLFVGVLHFGAPPEN